MGKMRESAESLKNSARAIADSMMSDCCDFRKAVGDDFMLRGNRDEALLKDMMKRKVARGIIVDDQ